MNKLKRHRAEELKDYREDCNIVFLDREWHILHEARACRWDNVTRMYSYSCNGKIVNSDDIFLWCTRKDLLELTNYIENLESILFK